ncbi:hypothetical protein NP493_15g05021 [Ridgeia piscesae]|uniref:DnaJ homolog subfamily C member 21 n=1 Tax=Ridgeia piscesae TaxID=27915 RepID=A0AAD9PEH1_RIDPI|nr:hypothetical protein NP493_15g05021 [Ridgeia piscesae]
MKCHYEVLGISKEATDDEIKKAYRKLALYWHPDKNLDRIEECTKQFHLIQQAYDVLTDPQERAWYDRHRDAILRGGQGHGDNFKDEGVDVYEYFNTCCYSGYGDDDEGFYAVYRGVFETIAEQDHEYVDDEDFQCPGFGDSLSSYEEVVGPFYAFWESYCTAKSYVWEEQHDTRQAPNRLVRRAMEAENKKLRDKARKERNEEVRALVAFVKKRDRRVKAYKEKLEQRAVEIARLTEEKKQKQRKERLEAMKDYKETDWSAMSEVQKDLEQLEAKVAQEFGEKCKLQDSEEEEEEEEVYEDDLFCVACNKLFKTEKAFANHEKSKKHKENVLLLRSLMEEEEDEDGVDDEMRLSGDEDLEGDTVQEAEGSVGSDLDVLSEEEEEPEPAPKSK